MSASPAVIIRQFLIDQLMGSSVDDWPIFVSFIPTSPDDALVIYDTAGVNDGRIMRTGEQIEHPGIQVVVRSRDYSVAFSKAKDIANAFDSQNKTLVVLSSEEAYVLVNVSRPGPIQSVGEMVEGNRRWHVLTINAMLTINAA